MSYYKKTLNMLETASGIGNIRQKTVCLETYCIDKESNSIGVRVYSDDGTPCDKRIEQFEFGNNIATAIDVLCNMEVPLGTKVAITISLELEDK